MCAHVTNENFIVIKKKCIALLLLEDSLTVPLVSESFTTMHFAPRFLGLQTNLAPSYAY